MVAPLPDGSGRWGVDTRIVRAVAGCLLLGHDRSSVFGMNGSEKRDRVERRGGYSLTVT
jgi:hypothetical protein